MGSYVSCQDSGVGVTEMNQGANTFTPISHKMYSSREQVNTAVPVVYRMRIEELGKHM
jgi:hypothetical protein